MGKRANAAIIGAFVIGAVILAVVGVALFGSGRLFRTTYPYVVYFTGDVNGLDRGAPVKFKGVEIGAVRNVFLNVSEMGFLDTESRGSAPEKVRIPVIIELDEETLTQKGSRVKPDAHTVKLLVDLGLRAQLATESFVTGLLYVKLDLYPGSDLKLVNDPSVGYPEIPTLPTPLEEAQMKAAKFLANLEQVDIKGLIATVTATMQSVNEVASSQGLHDTLEQMPETMRKLDQSLAEVSATLASVREFSSNADAKLDPTLTELRTAANRASSALDATTATLTQFRSLIVPDSPVLYEVRRSLADLSAASRAVRRFAEDLERNPSILVRGRAIDEESPRP